jgi:plasmid stabilization system protein ParE
MYDLSVTELAHEDIDSIAAYIATELSVPESALTFLDEVERCYTHPRKNPYIYEKCRDARLAAVGYRRAPVERYVLIFKMDEEKKAVTVQRVFYGARNYATLIQRLGGKQSIHAEWVLFYIQ